MEEDPHATYIVRGAGFSNPYVNPWTRGQYQSQAILSASGPYRKVAAPFAATSGIFGPAARSQAGQIMNLLRVPESWSSALHEGRHASQEQQLSRFLDEEYEHHKVFPPRTQLFTALELTPFEEVRVLVLGQDPYHGEGQAHGLSFSVPPETAIPPSLRNMFTELGTDLGLTRPSSGDLRPWAQQGVLLLNTVLSVRAGEANSHRGHGWEEWTDELIAALNGRTRPFVAVLWGNAARKKKRLLDPERHAIIEAPHPSPLSAHRGFFGSRPFSRINEALVQLGHEPIDWSLDPI